MPAVNSTRNPVGSAKKASLVGKTASRPPSPLPPVSSPISMDDLVLRSVNFTRALDDRLRKFAYDRRLSKSDIVRAALALKLDVWEKVNDRNVLDIELDRGRIGIVD